MTSTTEELEREVGSLKRRLAMVEGEIRVFTPPVSRLEKEMCQMRVEMNQRFDAVDRRFDAANLRFEALESRMISVDAKLDQILIVLRETIPRGSLSP